jgi:hypothetical protein
MARIGALPKSTTVHGDARSGARPGARNSWQSRLSDRLRPRNSARRPRKPNSQIDGLRDWQHLVLASLAIHLEQRRNARIERAELVALCSRHEPGRSPHGRARREGADNRRGPRLSATNV